MMKMIKSLALIVALATMATFGAACKGSKAATDQSTPTLAYKALYEAVKRKDTEGIKRTISKGTIEMMQGVSELQKKPFDQVIENGMTETTFAAKLPETRNEKIWGNVALLEVKNEKTGAWDALPFVKEDGVWKLAIDTYFKGTMSPTGPTNPEHPGELPPGAQPGPPQMGFPRPGQPSLKEQGAKPLPQVTQTPAAPGASPAAPGPQMDKQPPAPSSTKKP